MTEFRKNYLEYHENLKNEIDIQAEKLILSSQYELDIIDLYRSQFLNKIQSIVATALENSKNQSNFNFNQDQIFCFFVPRTNFEIDLKIFHMNIFGFLIIANQFIDQNVIKFLKKDFNKEIGFKRQILLSGKDVIILNLFRNLIQNRNNNSEGLIDLSDSNSNLLEKFVIKRNFIESFDKYDFEVVKNLINLNQLIHCDFEFNSLQEIGENLFSGLNGIKKFSLQVEEECSLKDKCFNGLNSLESFCLEGIYCTEISKEFFCGLTNLSHLEISYSNIFNLGKNAFDELPNLNCLKFISNDFESISDSSIKGLKNLSILELNKNKIFSVKRNAFFDFPKLEFFSLQNFITKNLFRLSSMNRTENLQCLILLDNSAVYSTDLFFFNLPNLKFLSINSAKVPSFKNNLIFLEVQNLDQLSNDSFKNFGCLKGLRMKVKRKLMKNIQKLRVINLQSIEHFLLEHHFEIEEKMNYEEIFELPKLRFIQNETKFSMLSNYEKFEKFVKNEILIDSLYQEKILEFMDR